MCKSYNIFVVSAEVSVTKWAIEYESPAADAFKLNHPNTEVFCENCNVILRCKDNHLVWVKSVLI